MNAQTFRTTLHDLQRRDAAEAVFCMLVTEIICAAIGFAAWRLL